MAAKWILLACVAVAFCVNGEMRVYLADAGGKPIPADGSAFVVKTESAISNAGEQTIRCRVELTGGTESRILVVAAVPTKGEPAYIFDGRKSRRFGDGVIREKLFTGCAFPMGAIWGGEGGKRGLALAVGATCEDSHADLILEGGEMRIEVHAGFLQTGAIYETVFHAIPFNPKYGEADAFARYYARYPSVFRRRLGVNPRIYGISAQYRSWRLADPELCRFAGASWEWCIGAARTWGDACDEWQPTLPRCGDWTWEEEINYRHRDGTERRGKNGELKQDEFDDIVRERLGFGYYCGVDNAFYMMALCNISKVVAARYPDSIATGPEASWNPYRYSTLVFPFPEVGWGVELKRQLGLMASKYDIGAVAFDVSGPGMVYRGEGLRRMSNVSWDNNGFGVVRGVGTCKVMSFVRTLDRRDGEGKIGVVVNSGAGHVIDKFGSDTVMSESAPWNIHPDELFALRRAVGEKGITFWEGYDLREIAPDIKRWSKEDRDRLVDEMSRAAVHFSFRSGISLPAEFLTEYTSLASHAFRTMNDAGFKMVPGASFSGEGWELARYGLSTNTYLAVNNLLRRERTARISICPGEIETGFAGEGRIGDVGFLFAPFYGGKAVNRFGGAEDEIEFPVGPQLAGVLESVGKVEGKGEVSASWSGDFDATALTVESLDFDGFVQLRPLFGTYRLEGDEKRRIAPGDSLVAVYRNTLLPGIMSRLDSVEVFAEIVHAPDADSRDMAERMAFFFEKATGKKLKLVLRNDLSPRSLLFGGELISDVSRAAFSDKVTRFLNALNNRRYWHYHPPHPMPAEDRARFGFIRF